MRTGRISKGGLARAAALALLLLFAASCAEEGGEATKVDIVVYTPSDVRTDPLNGVGWFRIGISGEGLDENLSSIYLPAAQAAGQLPGIPYGQEVRLVVYGHPSQVLTGQPDVSHIISSGASGYFSISPNSARQTVAIYLTLTNTYAQTARAPAASGPAVSSTSLQSARVGHTVTAIDDGRALIAGGGFLNLQTERWWTPADLSPSAFVRSLAAFDPTDGTVNTTLGNLTQVRAFHAAVKLGDGAVAFLGGVSEINNQIEALKTVEIYDPRTRSLGFGADLDQPRAYHTATLIPGSLDQVLVVGGIGEAESSYVVWTPLNGVVSMGQLDAPRFLHTATAVEAPGGNRADPLVLLTGGEHSGGMAQSMMVFHPVSGTFELPPISLPNPRTMHSTSYVEGRDFLYLMGGFSDTERTTLVSQIDVMQVSSRVFHKTTAFGLRVPRAAHVGATLTQNRVVVCGGITHTNQGFIPLSDGEIIFEDRDPATGDLRVNIGVTETMPEARFMHRGAVLQTGRLVLFGGAVPTATVDSYEGILSGLLYNP
jgi:hypothetical protein